MKKYDKYLEYLTNDEDQSGLEGKPTYRNKVRLVWGFGLILLLLVILSFRMGYWQIVRADDLRERAVDIQKVDSEIDSVRGAIYDTNGNVLAQTITEYELYGYTEYMYKSDNISTSKKNATVEKLAEILGKTEEECKELLNSDENLVLLGSGLTQKQVDKASDYWDDSVVVKTKVRRYYPNGAFASQVLGNVNSENTGRAGLEYEYNSVLAGVNGRSVKTTDSQGNTLANGTSKYYKAKDGNNIVTTIDSVIQRYAEDAIESGMQRTGAESITCIVMNPKTGDVLALAQNPEYDPNNATEPYGEEALAEYNKLSTSEQNDYLSQMWTLNAISTVYEPGSTFKLIASSIGLETGAVTDSSTYYCNGTIDVSGTKLHCLGHHGTQNIKEAVGNSCNPALARVALDIGADNFYQYIKLYGLMNKTGIDLPGETGSITKDLDSLGPVDLATMGYGQGIAISAIQLLCAVNAMGNDGILMKPKLVKEIQDNDGNTVEKIDDTAVRQVISKETADKMCEIMEYYTSSAGGTKAYVAGYRIGGKTGTANIASNGKYSEATDASYIAMAPMDDPVLSILVIVHKPTKTEGGNGSAGPIVAEVLENSLEYLGIERQYTESEEAKQKTSEVYVPGVTGLDSKDAIKTLEAKGFKVKTEPESMKDESFVVVDQYPKAGSKAKKNATVYLYSE